MVRPDDKNISQAPTSSVFEATEFGWTKPFILCVKPKNMIYTGKGITHSGLITSMNN